MAARLLCRRVLMSPAPACMRALSGWGHGAPPHDSSSDGRQQRRQRPQAQVVDTELVNAHHCVLEAQTDCGTRDVLRLVRRGLRLLDKGGNYATAQRLFSEGMARTAHGDDGGSSAAWVACNAVGISLMLGARHDEADVVLEKAQRHCEVLTQQGLVNDAYTDVAGVLCDRAANLIQIGEEKRVAEAIAMLKRAKFMAERAYRPSHRLLDSLSSNLAAALTLAGELEHAHDLAKSSVRTGDAMEALTTGVRGQDSKLVRTAPERFAHSKALALLASTSVKRGAVEEGCAAANRAWDAAENLPVDPLDSVRLYMCLASVHWLAAKALPQPRAEQEVQLALSRLQAAHALLSAREGGASIRLGHPDRVVCSVNILLLRRSIFCLTGAGTPSAPSQLGSVLPAAGQGRDDDDDDDLESRKPREQREQLHRDDFDREKARCMAAVRALRAKLGAENAVSESGCSQVVLFRIWCAKRARSTISWRWRD